jgi:hypothetical protein
LDTLEISGGSTTGIGAANRIAYWKTTDTITYDSAMFWDKNNKRLGLGVNNPQFVLHTNGDINVNGVRIGLGGDNDSTNIAIGRNALENYLFLDPGNNTAIGNNALKNNVVGLGNNAIGSSSLEDNTLGSYNLGIGAFVLRNNTEGNYNAGIGYNSLESNVTGSFNIGIGSSSGQFETGSYKLYISSIGSSTLSESRQKSIIYGEQSTITANQVLDLNAKVKPTYKPGTATGLAGYDSGGYLANVSIGSGLNLSSGTLTASGFTGGSGTTNYIPRWISSTSLGNSIIQDNGSNVNVNGAPDASYLFKVNSGNVKIGDATANSQNRIFFGDGTAVSVGEELTDNRLVMKGSAMSFNINGSYGSSGNVLMSNGLSATWQPITGASSDLFFTGTGTPYTLNSGTSGTDVQFAAGTGINLSMANNVLTIGSTSSTPATWFDWGSYIENWGNTGTFGSGKNVGISTPSSGPSRDFDVNGDVRFRGAIYNSSNSAGTAGQLLTSNGTGAWTWGNINMNFTGTASPYTLNTTAGGTGVTFAAGTGMTISRLNNQLTFTSTGGSTNLSYSGGSSAGCSGCTTVLNSDTGTDVGITAGNGISITTLTTTGQMTINTFGRHGHLYRSSDFTDVSLSGTPEKIDFTVSTANNMTASTANDRLTVNKTGTYRLTYDCDFYINNTGNVIFKVYKNNATIGYQGEAEAHVDNIFSANRTSISKTIYISLNANDYIELFYNRTQGTSTTLSLHNPTLSLEFVNE